MIESWILNGLVMVGILSAWFILYARSIVASAFALAGAFMISAFCWMLKGSEFLGLLLIAVYVGAIVTLFLFVTMTVSSAQKNRYRKFRLYLLQCFVILTIAFCLTSALDAEWLNSRVHLYAISEYLYVQNSIYLQAIGMMLLCAVMGVLWISHHSVTETKEKKKNSQTSSASDRRSVQWHEHF